MYALLMRFRIIIVLLGLSAAYIALPSPYVFAQQREYGGTLIFGTMGEPLGLDPGVFYDSESSLVTRALFETLVDYNPDRSQYTPVLAESWEISPDQRIYTFRLRKGVNFHDGKPFNAGSVKFSWERQMHSSHPFHKVSYGDFTYYRALWGGYPGNIKEIKIIDEYTLQVELYSRSYRFLKDISALPFAIVSPHAVNENKENFHLNPVGTGPFKFVEWRSWQRIVLDVNNDYWRGRPYLNRIVFEPAPGEKSRQRHMERNRIDIMQNPTTDFLYNIETKKRFPHIKVSTLSGLNFSYISINCQKPPFDNPLVRSALNYAIDKNRILRDINEKMPPTLSPFKTLWGLNIIGGKDFPLDHNRARQMFSRAGYPNGFEVDLWYPQISRPYLVSPERVAAGVAQSLREVGLKVRLRGMKWETYIEKLKFGQHELALTGFVGLDYDPDRYFSISWDRNNAVLGGTNYSFYRNDRIQNILISCRFEPDNLKRARQYAEIQKIIVEDSPIIPLYHYNTVVVMDEKIQGFSADKRGLVDFSKIWISK